MLLKVANTYVTVARELLDLFVGNLDAEHDFLPPPWYSVFCKFVSIYSEYSPYEHAVS